MRQTPEKSAECIKRRKIHDSPQFSHSSINQQQKEKFLGISAFFFKDAAQQKFLIPSSYVLPTIS
jgi:hypothetical protein